MADPIPCDRRIKVIDLHELALLVVVDRDGEVTVDGTLPRELVPAVLSWVAHEMEEGRG